MKVQYSLQQKQILSPQIFQSLNILQLNQLELTDYLKKKVEENIFLEEEEQSHQKNNIESDLYYNPLKKSSVSASEVIEKITQQQENIFENLLQQARYFYQEQELNYKICQYLLSSLNSHGFLAKEDFEATGKELQCAKEQVEKVRKRIQLFDPLGVGCFNIQEFLILQLEFKKRILF